MTDDIETLLRKAACVTIDDGIPVDRCVLSRELVIKSAATIARLRADLRAALKPFAELADQYERAHKTRTRHAMDEGHKPPPPLSDSHRVSISLGDCRRAASIIASHKENIPVQSHEEKQG